MKTRKSFISLVLVFAMIFSLNIAPSVANAEETTTKEFTCYLTIRAPYEDYNFDSAKLGNDFICLSEEDLHNSFGIGLPTDGSDGYTLLRVLCKKIRDYIAARIDTTDEEIINAEVKKYIDYDASTGWFNGLSHDGVSMNTGTTKDNSNTVGGSWMFYIDHEMKSDVAWNTDISSYNGADIDVFYCSGPDYLAYGYGHFEEPDPKKMVLAPGEKATYTVLKDVYDWNTNSSTCTPVKNATVLVYDVDDDTYIGDPLTTDENGKVTFSSEAPGPFALVVTEDITTEDGVTYSPMSMATLSPIRVYEVAKAASVKAKYTKTKKSKSIKVTFKIGSEYADANTTYKVYISKKKNSGYKQKVTKKGSGANKKGIITTTIKKMKKGTYYIKINTSKKFDADGDGANIVYKTITSGYTKPVKVKVK